MKPLKEPREATRNVTGPKMHPDEIDKAWLGLEDTHADPIHEGPYYEAFQPVRFEHEYADSGAHIRVKHGIQHSFPAGRRYGGSDGSGEKREGSEGDANVGEGLYGKLHERHPKRAKA